MRRSGFSITELFVSMAIIGLLMAVILPAVQGARAAARLADCRNRLHQIGIAIHTVEQSENVFPAEYDEIYHKGMGFPGYDRFRGPVVNEYGTTFRCPQDSQLDDTTAQSYVLSEGTAFLTRSNGYFEYYRDLRRASEFTDGQSQTVGFSEKLQFSSQDRMSPRDDGTRYALWLPQSFSAGQEWDFVNLCRSETGSAIPLFTTRDSYYTHLFTPNSRGCWNGAVTSLNPKAYIPASSAHQGGVNALFVDGHVAFIPDSVDAEVWMALGTINGNESTSSPF